MPRPDFTQYLLHRLAANWQTANFDPAPEFIDQRDSEQQSDGRRSVSFDLTENNAVTVGTQPTTTNTPIGTGFDFRYTAGLNVRIEAVHEDETYSDEPGGVAGGPDFEALVEEVRRIILADRRASGLPANVCWLTITEENDVSADEKDYFRTDLTVEVTGYEDLP